MTWALIVSWLALVAAAIYLDRLAERGMEALGREDIHGAEIAGDTAPVARDVGILPRYHGGGWEQ